MSKVSIIAIIGRPNVGKSTLFNRLIGRKYAVISKIPGTTRDRLYHEAKFEDYTAVLVDTGGLQFEKHADIEAEVQIQAKIAIADADIIFFLIDAGEELTKDDLETASSLRKAKKPVILIANKSDKKSAEEYKYDLYKLGFDKPCQISSLHNRGIKDLIELTVSYLKKLHFQPTAVEKESDAINIAILGRPNVGKSTLLNKLAGEKRAIVSETPGTTRDTLDIKISRGGQKFVLVDTAGLRRRGKIEPNLEKWSVLRTIDAIYRSDISLLLIDAVEGITNQDCHVSQFVMEANKGLIIIVNKTDLWEDLKHDEESMIMQLRRKMSYVAWAPVVFTSALTGKNVFKILDLAKEIFNERAKKIDDKVFKNFVMQTVIKHPAPSQGSRFTKIYGGKQTKISPPEFVFYVNNPDALHFSYVRYLENEIRKKFGFTGTMVKLGFERPHGKE